MGVRIPSDVLEEFLCFLINREISVILLKIHPGNINILSSGHLREPFLSCRILIKVANLITFFSEHISILTDVSIVACARNGVGIISFSGND